MEGFRGLEPGVYEEAVVWRAKSKTEAPGREVGATSGRWLYNRRE